MKNKHDPAPDEWLKEYLEITKTMYERMRRENSWPWEVNPVRWNEPFPIINCRLRAPGCHEQIKTVQSHGGAN